MPNLAGAYQWAINRCNAANVGYSQAYRNERTVNGITYYDCSSFIWYSLLHNGFDCITANGGSDWPFTTASMASVLPALGYTQYSVNTTWKPNDILLRGGHTELVYQGGNASGITMGAHTDAYPLADQVSINDYTSYATDWGSLWRYGNGLDGVGYECWMGWTPFESAGYLTPTGLAMVQYNGNAYGMYQFDYQYGLVPFMQYCYNYDRDTYSGFLPYIQMGAGNTDLIFNQGVIALFSDFANNRTDEFQYLQDMCAMEDYLIPTIEGVKNSYNIDITRDPVILGTAFSMAIRGGVVQAIGGFAGTQLYPDDVLLAHLYDYMAERHGDSGRWISGGTNSQRDKAFAAFGTSTDVYIIPHGGSVPDPTKNKKSLPIWMYGRRNYKYKRRF